jgi:hypothetical protein
VTKIITLNPERQKAVDIANEMLDAGLSMALVRVRVNKECPGLDHGAKRWTLLEIERARESISGAIHSPENAIDTRGAGEETQQLAGV